MPTRGHEKRYSSRQSPSQYTDADDLEQPAAVAPTASSSLLRSDTGAVDRQPDLVLLLPSSSPTINPTSTFRHQRYPLAPLPVQPHSPHMSSDPSAWQHPPPPQPSQQPSSPGYAWQQQQVPSQGHDYPGFFYASADADDGKPPLGRQIMSSQHHFLDVEQQRSGLLPPRRRQAPPQ
jgi:hypothetical protein